MDADLVVAATSIFIIERRPRLSRTPRYLFLLILLRRLKLVLIKEVNQVALARFQSHLTRELMHSQLLNDLKQVRFRIKFGTSISLEPFLAAGPFATA